MQKFQDVILDQYGNVVQNASIIVYNTGTTVKPTIYSDNGLTITTNPVTTDTLGRYYFYAAAGRYDLSISGSKITSYLETDVVLQDSKADLAASTGSGLVGFIQSGTGAVGRTVQAKERDTVSVKDFGAVGDGVTDDSTAVINARAASNILSFNPTSLTYKLNSPVAFGKSYVSGNDSTLKTIGLTFASTAGNDFYDLGMSQVKLDGTGQVASNINAIYVTYAHRYFFNNVRAQNYTVGGAANGLRLNNAFLGCITNCAFALNTYGVLLEQNSNAVDFISCSFNNNTQSGCNVKGSVGVHFLGGDCEYNYTGINIIANVPAAAAQPRGIAIVGMYFEGNTNESIYLGQDDTSGSLSTVIGSVVQDNYILANPSNSVNGITVNYSQDAKLLNNVFAGTFTNAKIFLKANSRNTTIRPFSSSDVVIEAGATVSVDTIQTGSASVVLDGAGNGFADVLFSVPYSSATPPIVVSEYATTDPATAVVGTVRINNVSASGFRIRSIGGTASATRTFIWTAGS